MYKTLLKCGSFLFLSLFSMNVQAKNITLAADLWCPYNCVPGSPNPGYMVEIARQALETDGRRVIYKIIPWDIAVSQALSGKISGVFGASAEDGEGLLHTDEPLGKTYNVYLVNTAVSLLEKDLDFDKLSIVALDGYDYGNSPLADYLKANVARKNVRMSSARQGLLSNAMLVANGAADMTIDEYSVVLNLMRERPDLAKNLKIIRPEGYKDQSIDVYISFSKNDPESQMFADAISEKVRQMRRSGELKALLQRYGLSDWKE